MSWKSKLKKLEHCATLSRTISSSTFDRSLDQGGLDGKVERHDLCRQSQRSVLQILQIGGNFLFLVSEHGRNLQSAAEFFISFVDQKALWFGYRCFE